MIIISNIDKDKFSLNGIPYFKNFMSHTVGTKLRIVNVYDSTFELAPFASVDQYNVNGVIHTTVLALQTALLTILYSRDTLGAVNEFFLGSIVPSSTPTGTGKAFWIATQAGTYTNFGGVVVNANSRAEISRDASGNFSISQTTFGTIVGPTGPTGPQGATGATGPSGAKGDTGMSKVEVWTAKAYLSGDQVNHLGKDWVANAAIVSTDVPRNSSKWVERLSAYATKFLELDTVSNLLQSITLNSYVKSDGTFATYSGAKRTDLIAITGLDEIWVSTLWTLASLRNCYYDAAGVFISNFTHSNGVLTKLTYPTNARFIALSSDGSNTISIEERYIDYKKIVDSIALTAANTVNITSNTTKIDNLKLLKIVKDFPLLGYYLSTGIFVSSTTFNNTGKIYIQSDESIFYTGVMSGGTGTGIHYFDSSDIFISKYSLNSSVVDALIKPPVNASYLIVSKIIANGIEVYIKSKKLLDLENITPLYTDFNILKSDKISKALNGFNLGKNYEKRIASVVQNNYGILMAGQSNMSTLIPYAQIASNSIPTTLLRTKNWNGTTFENYSLPINQSWGIWWSILYRLDAYLTKPLNYYRKASSGSSLAGAWNPSTNNTLDLSNQLASDILKTKLALPTINYKTVVWIQGESDDIPEYSSVYCENLSQFAGFVRGLVDNPLLHFTIVGMHPSQTHYNQEVRNQQVQFCTFDKNATFVSPDSLPFTSIDGTHYDGAYAELLAALIFTAIKNL